MLNKVISHMVGAGAVCRGQMLLQWCGFSMQCGTFPPRWHQTLKLVNEDKSGFCL